MQARRKLRVCLALLASLSFVYFGLTCFVDSHYGSQQRRTKKEGSNFLRIQRGNSDFDNDTLLVHGRGYKSYGHGDFDKDILLVHGRGYKSYGHKDQAERIKPFLQIGQPPLCFAHDVNYMQPSCSDVIRPSTKEIRINHQDLGFDKLESKYGWTLGNGGYHVPKGCRSEERVAIVVPYRDRSLHLKVLLNNLHAFLQRQKIQYMIIVVEQAPGSRVNRGMLRNIGFLEGEKICDFDCYFFHDIDLIPLREDNLYTCGHAPRHHAANLERWNHRLPYEELFGGVVSFRKDHFQRVNGYSNIYFGWGAEDDDLYYRVRGIEMQIERYPMEVSKYADLKHSQSEISKSRYRNLRSWKTRASTDGLNSIQYTTHLVEFRRLYTWIYVGIDERDVLGYVPDSSAL